MEQIEPESSPVTADVTAAAPPPGAPAPPPGAPSPGLEPGSLADPLLASWRRPRPPWSAEAFGVVILMLLVVWLASGLVAKIGHLIWWGVVALFLYFALAPAVEWLARRRVPRSLGALLVLLGVVAVAVLLVASLTPLVVGETRRAVAEAPALLAQAKELLGRAGISFDPTSNSSSLQDLLGRFQSSLPDVAGGALSVTSAVVGALFEGFVIVLFTFFLLADEVRIRHGIMTFLRPSTQVLFGAALDEAVRKTGGYLYSRILTSALAGTFVGVALVVLDCPYPVALAVWYGLVSQFVPMIGTYVAASLPLLVLVLANPWSALWFLLVLAAWIPLQDYVIGPRLSAKTMALSPASAVVALLVGASAFGPLGAFLALPAAAVFQSVGTAFFRRHEVVLTPGTQPTIDPGAGPAAQPAPPVTP